jgi:hypothetical protein
MSPYMASNTLPVVQIETAALAQLKATILRFRLKRSDDRNASTAPTMIAAGAP